MEKTRLQQVSPTHCTGHYENNMSFITTSPQTHAFLETTVAISSASTLGRKRKSNETRRIEGTDAKTRKASSMRVSPRISKQRQPSASTNNTEIGEGMKLPSVVRIKLKGKECREQIENSDSDFERPNIEVGEGSRGRKKPVKPKKAEKEAKPPRKLRLEGGSIVINEMTIHEVLKVPIGGLDLKTMDRTDEGVELAAIWKKQYKKESP
ncbi:hypothetical protein L6452_34746 [Arctium lappa]|uniref:Uncharacterized protein n=1 Tax=Arctium lappa TaxID=4217 RepID=A0ACB8YJB0_ARCLA|nr:hypothetical protein L6452_34746 [Arctium lappa]